jgi:hypothetical protein
MSDTVCGAVDGTDAFAFYIENTPLHYLTPGPRKYIRVGEDSLRESYYLEDGSFGGLTDPAGPEGALLLPGISIVEIRPIAIDEAIGVNLTIYDEEPGPAKPDEHLLFSEVSVEFLAGDRPYFIAPMGELAGLDENINHWRLPTFGIWRVRAYGDYDTEPTGGHISDHPDAIFPSFYKDSGRTPESLPCQIYLEFWPEKTLRDAVHKTDYAGDELITTPCTDYNLGATPEEIARRYEY